MKFLPMNRGQASSVVSLSPQGERLLHAFEKAWSAGEPPILEDFVPTEPNEDKHALVEELARVDMEFRAARGLVFSASQYVKQFPWLASVPGAIERIELEERRLCALKNEGPISDAWELQSRFPGFEFVGELGRGAFARVYLARQDDLAKRCVVLKVTRIQTLEAHWLAQLQHTNIVPIYSLHQSGSWQAICMPYLGATTLQDLVASNQVSLMEAPARWTTPFGTRIDQHHCPQKSPDDKGITVGG